MAAALATAMFERENLNITVSSAGVSAYAGSSASKNAILAMQQENIDLAPHKSQSAAKQLIQNQTLILAMTRAHLSYIKTIHPAANAFTLGEYANTQTDISDPFGGNLEEYQHCAAQIKSLLETCMEKFREGLK
jgi:protein-tyrosine-phosphatase